MEKKVRIECNRIYLRTLLKEDASKKYCSWLNDNDVNKYLVTKKTTIKDLQDYIEKRFEDTSCLFLGIFLKDDNIHIGNIKLEPIDFNEKSTTMGILIGEKELWGKGFATEALIGLENYAFEKLALKIIQLGVYKKNVGAFKVYKKAGFSVYKENNEIYKMHIIRE